MLNTPHLCSIMITYWHKYTINKLIGNRHLDTYQLKMVTFKRIVNTCSHSTSTHVLDRWCAKYVNNTFEHLFAHVIVTWICCPYLSSSFIPWKCQCQFYQINQNFTTSSFMVLLIRSYYISTHTMVNKWAKPFVMNLIWVLTINNLIVSKVFILCNEIIFIHSKL